jgi:hypothetical protein
MTKKRIEFIKLLKSNGFSQKEIDDHFNEKKLAKLKKSKKNYKPIIFYGYNTVKK